MMPYARRATLRGLSGCSHVSTGDVRERSLVIFPQVTNLFHLHSKGLSEGAFILKKNKKTTTLYNVLLCAFVCAGRMQADHGTSEV